MDSNSSAVVKTPMMAIGEKLRTARENKALTIDQVRKATHIYSEVLTALEDGRCDEMLNSTYVRSFLKKYTAFLGLDSDAILKEYSAHLQERTGEAPPQPVAPKIEEKKQKAEAKKLTPEEMGTIRKIMIVSFAALLIAFFLFSMFIVGKKIAASFKHAGNGKTAKTSVKSKTVTPPKDIPQKKASQDKEDSVVFKEPLSKRSPLYLVLKIKQPVLVKVRKDGVTLFERFMPKGQVESFRATDKIELAIGKAEAVELTLNGKSLGSPGRGPIKNLEITRKGIKIK